MDSGLRKCTVLHF